MHVHDDVRTRYLLVILFAFQLGRTHADPNDDRSHSTRLPFAFPVLFFFFLNYIVSPIRVKRQRLLSSVSSDRQNGGFVVNRPTYKTDVNPIPVKIIRHRVIESRSSDTRPSNSFGKRFFLLRRFKHRVGRVSRTGIGMPS